MINYSSFITTITYDPISWIDSSYLDLPYSKFSLKERRVINDIMINVFNFSPISLENLTQFEKEIIRFWPYLSRVFMLMACFRFKAYLPSSFHKLHLDKEIVQFLFALPVNQLQSSVLKGEGHIKLTKLTLQQQAFQEMRNFLIYCSDPIRERLFFLFPTSTKQQNTHKVVEKADFLLLRIMCHYARSKYSA